MTIALRAAGTPTAADAAVGSINPSPPAGWQTGDISILFVQLKPNTTTIATPTDWTKIGEWSGGVGTQGVDTGATKTAMFYRLGTSAATGTLSLGGASAASAVIHIFSTTEGAWDVSASTSGQDDSHGINFDTAATATALGWLVGDWVLGNVCLTSDAAPTSETLTAGTGVGMGTQVLHSERAVTTGNDLGARVLSRPITSTPSTASPTYSNINLSNNSGHVSFLRLREVVSTLMSGSSSGSFTLDGTSTGNTTRQGSSTGTATLSGVSTATTTRSGSSAGSAELSGNSTGQSIRSGSTEGSFSLSGLSSGQLNSFGSSTGVLTLSGSSSGSVFRSGDGDGTATLNGSSGGSVRLGGVSTGTLTLGGSTTSMGSGLRNIVVSGRVLSRNINGDVLVGAAPFGCVLLGAYSGSVPPESNQTRGRLVSSPTRGGSVLDA